MHSKQPIPVIRPKSQKRRGSRKLVVLLFLFFVTLLVVLFFRSPISRVSHIEITGFVYANEQQIIESLGVQDGDHFFAVSSSKLKAILEELPIIESAAVTKRFPGSILIDVKEYDHIAFEISPDGAKTAVLANGATVPVDNDAMVDKLILTGWTADDPNKSLLCEVLAEIPLALLSDLSEIKPIPSESFPDKIIMYTRSGFAITTAVSLLPGKIDFLSVIVSDNEPGEITMLLADHYRPYGTGSMEEGAGNSEPDVEP